MNIVMQMNTYGYSPYKLSCNICHSLYTCSKFDWHRPTSVKLDPKELFSNCLHMIHFIHHCEVIIHRNDDKPMLELPIVLYFIGIIVGSAHWAAHYVF